MGDAEDIQRTADRLNARATQAATHGLRVGYHTHDAELSSIIDEGLRSRCSPTFWIPTVALEVDLYWAAAGGQKPADLLRRLGERVQAVHVKDGPMRPASPPHSFRPTRSRGPGPTFRSRQRWPPQQHRIRRHRVRPLRRRHLRRHRPELRLPRLDPGGPPMSRTGKVGVGIIGAGDDQRSVPRPTSPSTRTSRYSPSPTWTSVARPPRRPNSGSPTPATSSPSSTTTTSRSS